MRTVTIERLVGNFDELALERSLDVALERVADIATTTPEDQTIYHGESLREFFDHAECKGHANFQQGSHTAFTATIEDIRYHSPGIRRDKLGDPAIGFVDLPDTHDVVSVKIEYYPVVSYGKSTYIECHDEHGNLVDNPAVEECVKWYCERIDSLLTGWAQDSYLYYYDEDNAREYAEEMGLEFYLDTGEIVR